MPGLSTVQEAARERGAALHAAAGDRPRIRSIIAAVAQDTGIPVTNILSVRRSAPVALARQMAMHLACELSGHGTITIGRVFDRDHTTVLHGRDAMARRMAADPDLADRMAALRAALTLTAQTTEPGAPA